MSSVPPARMNDLTIRLLDNFFRRWFFYLVPVAMFATVGFLAAGNVGEEYLAEGTLSVSSNPLVQETPVRGNDITPFETAAQGTARIINEQLGTDSFLDEVIDRAGLVAVVEAGILERDTIRTQLVAVEQGQSLVTVQAEWSDSATALSLVESTIGGYQDLVTDIVSADSLDAVAFLSERLVEAESDVDGAQDALDVYVQNLPVLVDNAERTTEQTLDLQRLGSTLDRAIENADALSSSIDEANLSVVVSQSEAGRLLRVVDEPSVPVEPESATLRRLLLIVVFGGLGLLISIAALAMTTIFDRSIRTVGDLAALTGAEATVVVPMIRHGRSGRSRNSKRKAA